MKNKHSSSRGRISASGLLLLPGLAIAVGLLSACERGAAVGMKENPGSADPVKRGEMLVRVGGCNDCHTPFKLGPNGPEPDMTRMLSGHPEALKLAAPPALNDDWAWAGSATNTAYAGPWGITYAINLTPDAETGTGKWTEQTFVQALKTGKHLGVSRPIMPPMPWPAYAQYPEDDLKAMFAYLRSLPPIKNRVPDYVPPTLTAKK
jgi:hypothetical protein